MTIQVQRNGIDSALEQAREAREDLAQKMTVGFLPLTALWGSVDWDAIATGDLLMEHRLSDHADFDDDEVREAITDARERLTKALMEGWMDGTSTNDVSNAMDRARRSAARNLLRWVLADFSD